MAQSTRKLAQNVFLNGEFYAAGSTPSKDIADQIDNPKAWGGDEADGGDGSEGDKGYAGMKPEQLQELATERELDVKGTGANGKVVKKDLVAALEAHDAAGE